MKITKKKDEYQAMMVVVMLFTTLMCIGLLIYN